jgi:UDP-N-acetylmuramoyl-tripeptide--D-alanyl-D-alanine ligase
MQVSELYKILKQADMRISTDTRTIVPGDIYLGLKGEQFDGNAYAKEALAKGARYAIIDNPACAINEQCIVVANTYETLKALATIHRQTFSIPVVVIGGSNGKTTTKELITSVLSKKYRVHTTKGNFNNEIGVPLTLLAMKSDTEIAVIEIGANHADEHSRLMDIVSPTHVLVTNNGRDHLEGFGTIEGVRNANKEIFDWATSNTATAFVNKSLLDLVEDSADSSRLLYPQDKYESTSGLFAGLHYGDTAISSHLFGSFNEANILAAIAVGRYFDISMEAITEAIDAYQPTLKRSQVIEKDGYTLVIDCYNANPTSMAVALNDFFHSTQPGTRIVVVGDMFEVGATEAEEHKGILELIEERADAHDVVWCVGPRFSLHQDHFPFHFFPSPLAAKDFFDNIPLTDKKIFLKASRGTKLEDVLS